MANYTAGSVTAEIILDSSKFKEEIEKLKGLVGTLKQDFNSVSLQSVAKDVEKLKKQMKGLTSEQDNLSKSINEGNEAVVKVSKEVAEFRKNFDATKSTLKETAEVVESTARSTGRHLTETGKILNKQREELNAAGKAWRAYKGEVNNVGANASKGLMFDNIDWEQVGFEVGKKLLKEYLDMWARAPITVKRSAAEINKAISKFADFGKVNSVVRDGDPFLGISMQIENLKTSMTGFAPVTEKAFSAATEGAEKYKQKLAQMSAELKKYYAENEKYYASVGAMSTKYWKQIRNSSVQNPKDWQTGEAFSQAAYKAQTYGLQDYYTKTEMVKKATQELRIATGELGTAYKTTGANLNTYKANLSGISAQLDKQRQSVERVKNAQLQLQYYQRTDWLNQYKANMGEVNQKLAEQTQNVRNAGRGITTFNNGIVQTAHSGRILSNTLYQIRGALLSLKMILTAMGGMALWGFAMELAEGVKATFTAKNEMEAQLNANAKVGVSGINSFNKALDETIARFQKINKYSLGETVSSIGLEFELTTKQMEKAMPIVAMIQSEYVRAGRTSEEAALAVKDILQGEFQRLSRETGVGKEELIAYGWDEDKTNIDGLLAALEKAAKDRNWDLFASKATSLNDVVEITKSRFSELGADLLQSISPAIVGAFNAIIGTLDWLQNSFNNLNSFWQNFALMGGGTAIFAGILTALPMITKGMGLANIATIGWGKSILTATFNLNKLEVAQYGVRKAMAAVITGTKASEVANIGATKAILGRVLGLNQSILAERGFKSAIFNSTLAMRQGMDVQRSSINLGKASILTLDKTGQITGQVMNIEMGRAQKLAYMTNNMKLAEAAELSRGKAILKTVTSIRILRAALISLMAINLAVWLAGVAAWTDGVKKNVDSFNNVVDNGAEIVEEAKTNYNNATSALEKNQEAINKAKADGKDVNKLLWDRNQLLKNQEVAYANIERAQQASDEAQKKNKELENKQTQINLDHQNELAEAYKKAGNNNREAELLAYNLMSEVNVGYYYRNKALDEYNKYLKEGVTHSAEHAEQMHKAGQDQEKINRYMEDYNAATMEVAENWKKFNEGDFMAGAYAILAQLKQQWIDFTYTEWFDKLQAALGRLWTWLQPKVDALIGWLKELAKLGINAFSWLTTSDIGNTVLTIGGLATAIGAVAWKFRGWIGTIKDSIGTLINWGRKLKDRKKDIEELGKKTEEANKKTDGGITGKSTKKPKKYEGWGDLKADIKQDFMGEARRFAKLASQIALAMGVVTVAIGSLVGPLLALALVGVVYKNFEQQAKDGIEGLKFVAPVVAAFLVPVAAIMYVMDKASGTLSQNVVRTGVDAAKAIAVGMLLVAEAVALMVAPMLAIAAVGYVKSILGDSVERGKEAIELVTDTLVGLYPIIPVFVAAIVAGSVAIGTEGIGALYMVGSLAIGMGLVAVAVVTLAEPLLAIGTLGGIFHDLTAVRRGAEAIKECATALQYVTIALGEMDLVDFELLTHYALKFIGTSLGLDVNLTDLTKEGGFFTEIRDFVSEFNKIEIEPVNPDKVTALNSISGGLQSITDALKNANDAINNIPPELKDPSQLSINDAYQKNTAENPSVDMNTYFEQLKEPLRQLKQFIDDFNNSEEFNFKIGENWQERVNGINQAASMLEQVNSAVERVKTVMGNVGGAQWNTAYAEGGIFGAVGNWLFHQTGLDSMNNGQGSGDYKSSLGSSLKQMEDIISDLFTFQSNVSTIASGGGEGADVDGVTSMVTTIQTAISTLAQTLSDAIPQFEGNGNAIGSAVSRGIKNGIGSLRDIVVPPLTEAMTEARNQAGTYGKGIGWQGTEGFKAEFKIKDAVNTELGYALQAMEDKKQDFYNKGYALGQSAAQGFKDGDDSHSPGIMARTIFDELDYISEALDNAVTTMPNQTYSLAESMASQFTPSFNLGLIDATDLSVFSQGLGEVTSMANTADAQTSVAFADMNMNVATNMQGMTMSVNGAFNTIQANATTSYAQITNTTRTSLSNMQSQTTKNINAIKSSWRGMQDALIASAENIRAETGAKINSLESNMASFWNKVQNPSLLLASGSNDGSIRTRNRPSARTGATKSSFSRSLAKRAAGTRMPTGSGWTGISDKLRPKFANAKKGTLMDLLREYLACLSKDNVCAAGGMGGWSFNWSDDIKQALLQWHTHFGEIYDPYLYVGKFENDSFPVRGISEIAKNYIYDAISRTSYAYYYNHRYSSAKEAYDAGAFNCVDGAMVAIGFADKFGFPGGVIRYGTWDGEGHGFADIPGLGIIDATAIQKGYGFTSPKVSGYGSSSLISNSARKAASGNGQTHNYNGDINLNINVYGDDVEVNENQVDQKTAKSIIDLLGINPHTGL